MPLRSRIPRCVPSPHPHLLPTLTWQPRDPEPLLRFFSLVVAFMTKLGPLKLPIRYSNNGGGVICPGTSSSTLTVLQQGEYTHILFTCLSICFVMFYFYLHTGTPEFALRRIGLGSNKFFQSRGEQLQDVLEPRQIAFGVD